MVRFGRSQGIDRPSRRPHTCNRHVQAARTIASHPRDVASSGHGAVAQDLAERLMAFPGLENTQHLASLMPSAASKAVQSIWAYCRSTAPTRTASSSTPEEASAACKVCVKPRSSGALPAQSLAAAPQLTLMPRRPVADRSMSAEKRIRCHRWETTGRVQ